MKNEKELQYMQIDSLEYSQIQRERIYKTKPWLKSTGATTIKGKEISKMNALKTNLRLNELIKQSKELWKQQRDLHKAIV